MKKIILILVDFLKTRILENKTIKKDKMLKRLENELKRLENEKNNIDISRFFENEDIREQRRLKRLENEKNNIDISRFFENEDIREQRQLKKLENEKNNIDIRQNGYCEICNTNIHKSSIAKHLRSIKHLENQLILPINFFKENLPSKIQKTNNPKSLKELSRDKIKDNPQKMLNPYYFKDKDFYNFLKINLDSHHINHLNSKITISSSSTYHDNIPKDLINRLVKEMATIYAKLISQFKFKYQCTFLAYFDKQDEDGMLLDEVELFINLKMNHILTESDLKKINVKLDLENQIQQQEMKDSGWRFVKIISLTIYFYKTQELNGSHLT